MALISTRTRVDDRIPDEPAVNLRRDLPFHQALAATLTAFEDAYLEALVQRHASLATASRASGIAVEELIAMLLRRGGDKLDARRAA